MANGDEATCPYCAETIKADAVKCRYCGEFLNFNAMSKSAGKIPVRISAYNPGLSAAMSAVLPGLGQIFQGRLNHGFAYIGLFVILNVVAFKVLISSGDTTGVAVGIWIFAAVIYVINVYDAHFYRPPTVDYSPWGKES